jgi:hypothetical protein
MQKEADLSKALMPVQASVAGILMAVLFYLGLGFYGLGFLGLLLLAGMAAIYSAGVWAFLAAWGPYRARSA